MAEGADAFLTEEYKILAVFCFLFAIIIACLVEEKIGEFWTVFAFLMGAITSILAGWIGMKVAVIANLKTAYSAIDKNEGLANAFIVAFRGGCVLGFCLCALGLANLLGLIMVYDYM